MSSAMNHRARSRRSYAKHRSACSGHARRTIFRQTPKRRPGLLELLRSSAPESAERDLYRGADHRRAALLGSL